MRVLPSVVGALLLGAWSAAHADGFDGQRYVPAMGGAGGFEIERALVPQHLDLNAGFFVSYADDPVVVIDRGSGEELRRPVDRALTLDLVASIGLFDFAELAVLLPMNLSYQGDSLVVGVDTWAAAEGVGDLRVMPKFELMRTTGFGLGFAVPVSFPTGDPLALAGAGDTTIEPRLLMTAGPRRLAFAFNAGYRLHTTSAGGDGPAGNELTFDLGARYNLSSEWDWVSLHVELFGAWNPDDQDDSFRELPLEGLLGVIIRPDSHWQVYLGATAGLLDGVGTPDVRGIFGVRWAQGGWGDRDGDHVYDQRDRCPNTPEDRDHDRDHDGCPEGRHE
jgi:hypothetical protein